MSNHLYRGLAGKAKLVLVKTGNLRGRGIRDRDISRALIWVLNNHERFNIRIVNISLGGDNRPQANSPSWMSWLKRQFHVGLWSSSPPGTRATVLLSHRPALHRPSPSAG